MTPEEVRLQFPILKDRAYLFSGGLAPTTTRTLEAMQRHIDKLTYDADEMYMHTNDDFVEARRLYAWLIGADQDEIVVNESTSAGSNLAVELIDPIPGSNVVFDEFAYPSSVFPWMLPPRDKVERRFVQPRDGIVHLEDVEKVIDANTLAVSVSEVTPGEGFRHNVPALAKIAYAHDALLLVDGAQSAGALNINVHDSGVDFYTTTAMKWLLGPAGVGFLYIARKHLDRIPSHAGYASSKGFGIHDFELVEGAQRFQLGMPNLFGMAATIPGLEILLETGMDKVEAQVLDLSGYCITGMKEKGMNVITPQEPEHRLGVIAAVMDDARQLWEFLYKRGVDTYYHENLFRVDPHVFNNRADIDRFMEGVDAYYADR